MPDFTDAQIGEMAAQGAIERTGGKGSYRRLIRNLVLTVDERRRVVRLAKASHAALKLYESRDGILIGEAAEEAMDELRAALLGLAARGSWGRDGDDDEGKASA